jgi:serine protease Do
MTLIRVMKGPKKMWRTGKRIGATVLATLILIAPSLHGQQARRSSGMIDADLSASLEATARAVSPSVVEIFATSYVVAEGVVPNTADLVTTQRGSGSGVIVDPEGFIITNAHVVRGARHLRVNIPISATGHSILAASSRTVTGQLVGMDPETDLAVIKVGERNLPAVPFGDSENLKAGQMVLAVGSPLGFQNSVSLGVVSAVARQLQPESPMIYIQTDASINPGSSGGPLVDLHGHLVGINTLMVAEDGHPGPGFAAPSNIVRNVYEQIRKDGRVRRGEIGIRAQTLTPVLASGLKLPRDYGVIIADVSPGSPAARVGARPGDIVVSLDGKPIENSRQLQVNLYGRLVGDVVTLEIMRDDQTLKLRVAITEREKPYANLPVDPRDNLVGRLGILALNLDPEIAQMLPVSRVRFGIVVVSTVAGAIDARDGGLAAGDIIFSVNRRPVNGLSDLRTTMDNFKTGDPVVLQLQRNGELMYLAFTVE